jgi:hypothetical protein
MKWYSFIFLALALVSCGDPIGHLSAHDSSNTRAILGSSWSCTRADIQWHGSHNGRLQMPQFTINESSSPRPIWSRRWEECSVYITPSVWILLKHENFDIGKLPHIME